MWYRQLISRLWHYFIPLLHALCQTDISPKTNCSRATIDVTPEKLFHACGDLSCSAYPQSVAQVGQQKGKISPIRGPNTSNTTHYQYPQHHFRILKLKHVQINLLQSFSYPSRHTVEEWRPWGGIAQEVKCVDSYSISEKTKNCIIIARLVRILCSDKLLGSTLQPA